MTQQHSAAGDADPVIAMIRKAGLSGFVGYGSAKPDPTEQAIGEEPVLALVAAAGLPGFKCSAVRTPSPSEDPMLALIGAAGLAGFKSSEVRTPSPSDGPIVALVRASGLNGFVHDEREVETADVDPVVELIAKAGLPGFKAREIREPVGTKAASKESSPTSQLRTEADVVRAAAPRARRLSKRDYAVVHIAATGGQAALASLEERMGRPLSTDQPEGALYSVQQHADGSSSRAFAMASHERRALAPIVGELGSPALRLSFEPIDIRAYTRAGPGAAAARDLSEPMQMAPSAITALVRVLG